MKSGADRLPLKLVPVADCQTIRGVLFPAGMKFRQLVVTGPPGSGKTTLMKRIHGWSEEGYIDLTLNGWWKAQSLTLRPREMHLGLPFKGRKDALALFEPQWLADWDELSLDEDRIRLPPEKRFFWSVDWRARFVFEFLLPVPERVFELRRERAKLGTHPVDAQLDLEQIRRQVAIFAEVAEHFHGRSMTVYTREDVDASPYEFACEVTDRKDGLPDR